MRPRRVHWLLGLLVASTTLCAAAPGYVLLRVPAGKSVPVELAPLLARWRASGELADALLLTHGRPEKAGDPTRTAQFEALAVLEFSSEASADRWEQQAASLLPTGLIVRRADALAHGAQTARDPSRAAFVVNTYTPIVSPARFREFVSGYVQPLYEAMRRTQHLVCYTAYLERGETGKVDAFNVLEYRDAAALVTIGAMKAQLREEVAAAVPTYAQFDRIKDTLRRDGFGTAATYTALPPPPRN